MLRKEFGTPCLSAPAKARARHGVYVANFFYALHTAVIIYFQSNYLVEKGFSENGVGLLYAVGSILSITSIFLLPPLLSRIGNFAALTILIVLEALALLALSVSSTPLLVGALFMFVYASATVMGLPLDIFLEETTESESKTGSTRGMFITMYNIAFAAAPASAGYLVATLGNDNLGILFLISALVLVPMLPLAFFYLRNVPNRVYQKINFAALRRLVVHNSSLRTAFMSQLLLRMFFTIMVIYGPLYLHVQAGLSFATIGIISSIMLLAYVLLELPLGHLAQHFRAERGIMTLGFLIAAIATASIPFVPLSAAVALWAFVFFFTRVGGAMIDITSETYFFKQIDGDDTDALSIFRSLGPLSSIIGPVLGSVVIAFGGIENVFILGGVILALGIPVALRIKS